MIFFMFGLDLEIGLASGWLKKMRVIKKEGERELGGKYEERVVMLRKEKNKIIFHRVKFALSITT